MLEDRVVFTPGVTEGIGENGHRGAEKKEKAYMKALQKKADKLQQKIDSLNGTPGAPPVISTTRGPQNIPAPPAFRTAP